MHHCPYDLKSSHVNQYDVSGHVPGQGSSVIPTNHLSIIAHVADHVTGHMTAQGF